MCGVEQNKDKSKSEAVKANIPNALLASLNLLGPLGSVFSTAVGGYLTTRRLENIEDMLRAMGKKLRGTDPGRVKDYLCSDEFMHLFLTAVQKEQIEHQKEKRQLYGAMLGNMAIDIKTKYDQKSMFISALSEIEVLHVETLRYLDVKGESEDDDEKWASFDEVRSAVRGLCQNTRYVAIAVLQKLASCGFVKSKGKNDGTIMTEVNPVGLWFHSLYRITDLGERFLEFLKG